MQTSSCATARLLLRRVHLQHNVSVLRQSAPHVEILAMVKANAYGHGLEQTVRELSDLRVNAFGVATLDEALAVRKLLPRAQVVLWSGALAEDYELIVRHQITPVLFSLDGWYAWVEWTRHKQLKHYAVHLEIDSGIARSGLLPQEHARILSEGWPQWVHLEALATHYSASESNKDETNRQRWIFEKEFQRYKQFGLPEPKCHASNSGALLHEGAASWEAWVRPGLMLYGYSPVPDMAAKLRPVACFQARVIGLKWLESGQGVSYNSTFRTTRRTCLATLGVGYADGLPRELSNRIKVSWPEGQRAPLVGTVCMDVVCCDVTDFAPAVATGQWVTLFGDGGEAVEWAHLTRTIPYEILTGMGSRVLRTWVTEEGKFP